MLIIDNSPIPLRTPGKRPLYKPPLPRKLPPFGPPPPPHPLGISTALPGSKGRRMDIFWNYTLHLPILDRRGKKKQPYRTEIIKKKK